MNATSHVVTMSAEAQAQLAHSHVLARRSVPERLKPNAKAEDAGAPMAGSVYSPNAYMLLVSRLENMIARGQMDERTLEQLRTHIAQHLAALPEHSRQTIRALEGYTQIGAESFQRLPETLTRAVRQADKSGAALTFMKQPEFVAYMRNEPSNRLYSPRGLLRAS